MASTSGGSQQIIGQKNWELTNNITTICGLDEIYQYDSKQQQDILDAKPWDKDPYFFKQIRISALALLKMVMHARSGGTLEVMGMMLGKVDGATMVVMDVFALPVEGTETRVNAQSQAYEYMSTYVTAAKEVGRQENVIGWYHSHPGYGCWLSGIDVSTQLLNQSYQEPFVAIVLDPIRTMSAGKVNIGAFRTYPKGYKPPDDGPSEYQTIPLHKIEDFGVHCNQYYALDVSYFKSALDKRLLDSLWNKYWLNTLTSSSLLTNAEYTTQQICDLSDKLETSESLSCRALLLQVDTGDRKAEDKLTRVTRDSSKTTMEALHGLMAQVIKDRLFNHVSRMRPKRANRLATAVGGEGGDNIGGGSAGTDGSNGGGCGIVTGSIGGGGGDSGGITTGGGVDCVGTSDGGDGDGEEKREEDVMMEEKVE